MTLPPAIHALCLLKALIKQHTEKHLWVQQVRPLQDHPFLNANYASASCPVFQKIEVFWAKCLGQITWNGKNLKWKLSSYVPVIDCLPFSSKFKKIVCLYSENGSGLFKYFSISAGTRLSFVSRRHCRDTVGGKDCASWCLQACTADSPCSPGSFYRIWFLQYAAVLEYTASSVPGFSCNVQQPAVPSGQQLPQ